MNGILSPIKPELVAKILNGEKTIDVLKTAPKCELPVEVYIYCTKAKPYLHQWTEVAATEPNGIKGTNKVTWEKSWHLDKKKWYMSRNGKVVAKFTLRRVEKFDFISEIKYEGNPPKYNEEIRKHNRICKEACISPAEVVRYLDTKCLGSDNPSGMIGYAWHIEDLIIFDQPKKLNGKAPRHWQYIDVE